MAAAKILNKSQKALDLMNLNCILITLFLVFLKFDDWSLLRFAPATNEWKQQNNQDIRNRD